MAYSALKCPIISCDFSSKQEKKFLEHITIEHCLDHEAAYTMYVLSDTPFVCECGCKQKTKWYGWKQGYAKFLRGHNAKIQSSFSNDDVIQRCVEKRKIGFKEGKYKVWNDGLTKDDIRIQSSANKASKTLLSRYESREIIPWQIGLTKDTDNRILKMSKTKESGYKNGKYVSWNLGLDKSTNISVLSASQKISDNYKKRLAGKRLNPDDVRQRIELHGFDLIDENYETRKESLLNIKCRNCSNSQLRTLYSVEETGKCFICSPKESKGQLEIYHYITETLGISAHLEDSNIVAPLIVDIVVDSAKIAIEFNGLYWHSEKYRDKDYHNNKTVMCENAGYKLLHIFEDEWRDKRSILESMIKYRLKLIDKKIGARECNIRVVSHKDRKDFFEKNHIDGDAKSTYAIGLYKENELVSCLSLRRPFHKKWESYFEIARFASVTHSTVSGALARLSKYALDWSKIQSKIGLISYVDTRYGDGSGYKSSGFTEVDRTSGTFWWTDMQNRFNRFKFRADKSQNISEADIAKSAGVTKIHGCSQLIMLLENKSLIR